MPGQVKPETVAATYGIARDREFRAVVPPVYLSSTFAFAGYQQPGKHDYTRASNPTRDLLADTIAELEGGKGAVVTSSGMAAVDLVLSLLGPGDLVVAPHDCYGGTYRLLSARKERKQFDVIFVDQGNEAALAAAFNRRPRLVLVETPSNPLMRVIDIRAISRLAKAAGAQLAVDNTFLSPALQQPISLGEFVIHSTTKFINGHSDVVGGVVVAADRTDVESLTAWANVVGTTGAPFDAYLTLRGLGTLFPRVERQQSNAQTIANFLESHPLVRQVYYPGLKSHPGHSIAKSQQRGFGAMLSFELKGGTGAVSRFAEGVQVFTLAESLGGVESLIAHPATMTHASMGAEARRAAGVSDQLIRLSVGLEAEVDLIAGLVRGFDAIGDKG